MATFTLTYPKAFDRLSKLPILNSQNETVCILQKVERSNIGKVLNAASLVTSQQPLPHRYETRTTHGEPLFQVRSTLLTKGVSHEIIMPDGSIIPIQRKTVQLLESSYSFTMDGLVFRFEKDFTSTAYLYCNDEKIASANFVENGIVREGIIYKLFHSEDTLFVALLASLFQSLFAIGN
ncbi:MULTISPECIES: tubby C-terminal domain-like protein [unclassified Lysinibacillus]|uniref:tubby C-terminal domain-like protein n=1 Tax=unclassified Lysinibacillus TaxID=2636778 RepID=UPI0030F80090